MTSTLRQLSKIYLGAASAFVVMIVLAQHPDWAHATRIAATAAKDFTVTAAIATNKNVIQPGWAYSKEKSGQFAEWAGQQMSQPTQVAKKETPAKHPVKIAKTEPLAKKQADKPAPQIAENTKPVETELAPVVVAKNEPAIVPAGKAPSIATDSKPFKPAIVEDEKPSVIASAKPPIELAPLPDFDTRPTVSRAGPSPAELIRVAQRLKSNLTQEMMGSFELFLYVSKADTGSWSQRMYVFAKRPGGDLDMMYNWPVSTGREKVELDVHGKKQNSFTPQGYYELDPHRMHAKYHSSQWNQPMPYAMFFNWEQNGYQTGLAIHGASGDDIDLLGQRSSAGCVRLAPENARILFSLIRSQYKGLAPKFAYDRRTASMANDGLLMHDKNGKVVLDDGYKVLVFIENYGGNDVVAALF